MTTKTLKTIALSALVALGSGLLPALAAGTTPLALVPQFDVNGNAAPGCQLNFYVAGTVATPQNAYADFGLTTPLANPLPCDQAGRVPMHWLADGLIHVRLTTSDGNPIIDTTMQVLGPSSGGGGGGGGTVDPTTIAATGDEKIRYGTGPISGWVRENGLTIGSAVSGATERANADTQALFIYLYNTDANLTVSGGRTGNALNDYNANKTITTPDMRGRLSAGLDDMGNILAGRLSSTYFGVPANVLGTAAGSEWTQLTSTGQLPLFTPAGSISNGAITSMQVNISSSSGGGAANVTTGGFSALGTFAVSMTQAASIFTGTPIGAASPNAFRTAQPTMLKTFYIKL